MFLRESQRGVTVLKIGLFFLLFNALSLPTLILKFYLLPPTEVEARDYLYEMKGLKRFDLFSFGKVIWFFKLWFVLFYFSVIF